MCYLNNNKPKLKQTVDNDNEAEARDKQQKEQT